MYSIYRGIPSCFKKSIIVPIPKKNKITCLNDWRPVALTPIFSKCFEKLVRDYICSVLPASLDPLQFAYRCNRSIDDAIAFTLHTALSHLENKNTYVRMLFVDYSSAFNTIVPATLVAKLQMLGLNRSLCSWILDFLTGRSQVVRMGNNTSSPLVIISGAPQGCVLSPLLYSLYTHDCTATHSSNAIVKFANDTTVIGLITDNDETAYREEVSTLTKWCQENHLSLNIDKTKELVVDYRRQSREHTPITIDKTPVERVNSFKFLSVHITEDLTWSAHTDSVLKKAHSSSYGWGSLERAPASSDHSTPALWRVEIDRYIGSPIFFPIFKHFTIIGYRFKKNKGYIYFFVTYRIIQSLTSSEMCSLYLTHPSTHTWSSGHCSLRKSSSMTTACNF